MIMESKYKNDSAIIQPLSNNDLRDRNFIEYGEEIVKKLNKFRHSSGVLIGHVLRRALIPMDHAVDRATNYITHDEEACARCRIINALDASPAPDTAQGATPTVPARPPSAE